MGDVQELIKTAGYLGLFAIVTAESGLPFGFFLPGDSLLVSAGVLATQGYFNLWLLIIILPVAAILGDNLGYRIGQHYGPKLFSKPDSLLFKQEHIQTASKFYDKHGGKTLILARFTPVVRTFAPIIAGASNMEYRRFFFYNSMGGVIWSVGMTLLGALVGHAIPDSERYILPIMAGVIVLSLIPGLFHAGIARRKKKLHSTDDKD
jgi:membrane-associated protein